MTETLAAKQSINSSPTRPEIEKLIDRIGVPNEGDDISTGLIEATLNISKHTSRWNTIIARLKETYRIQYNVILICKRGEGLYHACTDDEKVDEAMRRKGNAQREAGRIRMILDTVNASRLSKEHQEIYDNIRLTMQHNILQLAASVK